MGDSTIVELTILTIHKEAAKAFFTFRPDHEETYNDKTIFEFYAVNYGELPWLKFLQENGIAYDSCWDNGIEFGAGTEIGRFTPEGKLEIKTTYIDERNPCIDDLLELINSPEELKAFILVHHKKVTPLPWDNQEEYGKLFRMNQPLQIT